MACLHVRAVPWGLVRPVRPSGSLDRRGRCESLPRRLSDPARQGGAVLAAPQWVSGVSGGESKNGVRAMTPEAERLMQTIKAAVGRASAGNMALAGADELRPADAGPSTLRDKGGACVLCWCCALVVWRVEKGGRAMNNNKNRNKGRRLVAIIRSLDPSDPRSLEHPCHRDQWLKLAKSIGRSLADQEWTRRNEGNTDDA
jgi:hypothetical protein